MSLSERDKSESLERIHTFSLKSSFQAKMTPNTSTLSNHNETTAKECDSGGLGGRSVSKGSSNKIGGPGKTYYVEESVKILRDIINRADPILTELASKIKQFERVASLSYDEREKFLIERYGESHLQEQKSQLKVSFHSEKEIEDLKKNPVFKMNVRNALGLRHSDDWIFNLNIGNVMHLSLMSSEELGAQLESTHELGKDSMLEKIVLVTVAYFCIATEMRFLV